MTAAPAVSDTIAAPVPGAVTATEEQADGTTLTYVEETSEPELEGEAPNGDEIYFQCIDTTIWVEEATEEGSEGSPGIITIGFVQPASDTQITNL